jgi:hypothetical protein
MAKRRREKRMEEKRVTQEAETMKRVADTTFYTIMPQLMKNAAINIENGLRREKSVKDLVDDHLSDPVNGTRPYVLIIAAGPSLERFGHLEMLRKHYDDRRFTIVAVDAVFARLCKLGIYPDYVISADVQEETASFYQPVTYKTHRSALENAGTRAILMGNIDPEVIKIWGDLPAYYYWPTAPFGKHLDAGTMWNLMVDLGIVNPHGHVTGAALSIFTALGKVVALIGADYSYLPGESYENTYWYKWLEARGRTHEEIIEDLKPEWFKDRITGEEIMTDVPFMQYLAYMFNWLETMRSAGEGLKVVNCTGRGLFYDPSLVPYVSFEKFLEESKNG